MTGKERTDAFMHRKPHDRIPVFEGYWEDTRNKWLSEGHLAPGEDPCDHFGLDMRIVFSLNRIVDWDFVPQVLEEDEDTKLVLDGNGAVLRHHKKHDSTPEHVRFTIKDRKGWEEAKPKLTPSPDRIDFKRYRDVKEHAEKNDLYLIYTPGSIFDQMTPLIGHVATLTAMAEDPDWVLDMADTYANLLIGLMEILFEKEGYPDCILYGDDLGYKHTPFMSPAMFDALLAPSYRKLFGYGHSIGPVMLHSCGNIEKLVPSLIRLGLDCLHPIETKAGMDLVKLYRMYGEHLSFMGGFDVPLLSTNNITAIDADMDAKIPIVKNGYGYALHSDHSIPPLVEYETYRHFVERGRRLGTNF